MPSGSSGSVIVGRLDHHHLGEGAQSAGLVVVGVGPQADCVSLGKTVGLERGLPVVEELGIATPPLVGKKEGLSDGEGEGKVVGEDVGIAEGVLEG